MARGACAGRSGAPAYNARVTPPLPDLVLYSRPGCHLCEDTHATVRALLAQRAGRGLAVPVLVERNIEDDDDWQRRYALTIPVLAAGHRELELAIGPGKVGRFLTEILDGVATSGVGQADR